LKKLRARFPKPKENAGRKKRPILQGGSFGTQMTLPHFSRIQKGEKTPRKKEKVSGEAQLRSGRKAGKSSTAFSRDKKDTFSIKKKK